MHQGFGSKLQLGGLRSYHYTTVIANACPVYVPAQCTLVQVSVNDVIVVSALYGKYDRERRPIICLPKLFRATHLWRSTDLALEFLSRVPRCILAKFWAFEGFN